MCTAASPSTTSGPATTVPAPPWRCGSSSREPDARPPSSIYLHGLRDRRGKADTPDRHAQAERIARLVQAVREPDDLVVVCGDLNLLPDSQTFAILAAIGLVDLVGTADTRTSQYPKPVRHASYVLVSDPAAVRRFDIL